MPEIQKEDIASFLRTQGSALNTFRTLILFGRNTATYKFAFCHALMNQKAKNVLKYDDLRDDFMRELVKHYQSNPHQFTRGQTGLTNAIDTYLQTDQSEDDWQALMQVAEQSIYNNVFDAFQNVGMGTIDSEYLLFEHDKENRQLILTDNTNAVLEDSGLVKQISLENQSRWNVVEEAWRTNLSPNLLVYHEEDQTFYSVNGNFRVGLRSAVDVLLPYQKGKCFYCNRPLNRFIHDRDECFPDVDHYFPLSLLVYSVPEGINPNGVWNLVIACMSCNRGPGGKFDAPPDNRFFEKLLYRNLLYVEEHNHSLKNSILLSLGAGSKAQVLSKMKSIYEQFRMIRGWSPSEQH